LAFCARFAFDRLGQHPLLHVLSVRIFGICMGIKTPGLQILIQENSPVT
jgi:hypothetical protein